MVFFAPHPLQSSWVFCGEWGKVKKRVKGDFKLGMVSLVAEGQTQLQAFLLLSKEMAFKKTKSPATINKKPKNNSLKSQH